MAANRVSKALGLLRSADGTYRELYGETPNGQRIRIYASADKFPKQIACERGGKKLESIVKEVATEGQEINLIKAKGMITVNWKPLVRVVPLSPEDTKLDWKETTADSYNFNIETINQRFTIANSSTSRDADRVWASV